MTDKKDTTIPNPAHYLGRAFIDKHGELGVLTIIPSIAIGLIGAFSAVDTVRDAYNEIPDTTGSEIEATILAQHTQTLNDLKIEALRLEQTKANNNLNRALDPSAPPPEQTIEDLSSQFTNHAQQALLGLYLDGATEDGAAVSEEQFETLHTEFWEQFDGRINLQQEWGLHSSIEAGALDECLTEMPNIQSNNDLTRYNNAKELNQCMRDHKVDGGGLAVLSGIGGAAGGFLGSLIILGLGGFLLQDTPKNITLRRRKKHLPKDCKH